MSTINLLPTFRYSQPDEYRFSHDSVFLAQKVFDLIKTRVANELCVLDLCAGCGIVGMDFMFHAQDKLTISRCDFVEVQKEYEPHFLKNAKALNTTVPIAFQNQCYSNLLNGPGGIYDLILCNPPYFHPDQGRMPESEFKRRCRFFIDSDFATLLRAVSHVLKPNGEAYILLRDAPEHGRNVHLEAKQAIQDGTQLSIVGDIRGTPLALIKHITAHN